ncbi:MAG: CBS domain-containing protein, partial [Bacteroidia bacterium]|nr:CBS domain-containing protein [Bacteroidia bacterium]
TENDKVVGIISIKDIFRCLYNKLEAGESINKAGLENTCLVSEIMSASPLTVSPDATLTEAMDILAKSDFRSLPVAENGVIKGIITNKDIVRAFSIEQHPPQYFTDAPGFGV